MIQTGIVALGATVAIGTLSHDSPIAKPAVVQQIAAGDSAARARMSSLLTGNATASPATPAGGLDIGVEHPRIDFWVKRLSTTMAAGFRTSLDRMDKYADMITGKLAAIFLSLRVLVS